MRQESVSRGRRGLLFLLMCVLLCPGTGAVRAPERETPPGLRRMMDAPTMEGILEAMLNLHIDFAAEDGALDLREQTDFLLTPALLVQEAVSDGVVLTYPGE